MEDTWHKLSFHQDWCSNNCTTQGSVQTNDQSNGCESHNNKPASCSNNNKECNSKECMTRGLVRTTNQTAGALQKQPTTPTEIDLRTSRMTAVLPSKRAPQQPLQATMANVYKPMRHWFAWVAPANKTTVCNKGCTVRCTTVQGCTSTPLPLHQYGICPNSGLQHWLLCQSALTMNGM